MLNFVKFEDLHVKFKGLHLLNISDMADINKVGVHKTSQGKSNQSINKMTFLK